MMHVNQIIMLYTLSLYSALCLLYLKKAGRKNKTRLGGGKVTCNTCYLRYMFSDLYMNLKLSLTVILKTINHYFKTTINIEASQAGLYWMPKISCHLWGSTSINWPEVFINWEKAMAPHSSTLAWKIPWTEEPGRLQSTGSLRVGHDWATSLSLFTFMH